MSYRVSINKDYKPEIEWVEKSSKCSHFSKLAVPILLVVPVWSLFQIGRPEISKIPETVTPESHISIINTIPPQIEIPEYYISDEKTAEPVEDPIPTEKIPEPAEYHWQKVIVKNKDNLALIFSRLGLNPKTLYQFISSGKDASRLKKLRPEQILNFSIKNHELLALEYTMDLTKTVRISKKNGKFLAEKISTKLESVIKNANVIIMDSLYLSGKRAGLSDNLIMQLVAIYGWDIDFALDIREKDAFTVIYEEKYKDGQKVADGPIMAAEFINKNNTIRAVRYTHDDGHADYYNDKGVPMRKAFLRTPVNFTRISSRFNLKRKHPILNRIRAHKGVDYAAPVGTEIKSTGDGKVAFVGTKNGYGRTIILQHGDTYSTVYAHLSNYANRIKTGKRIKQGQIIGYVGKSGLATGPHLHYEFRVNGVHHNPLTVKLPSIKPIDKKYLAKFQKEITPMLAELDRITSKNVFAAKKSVLASNDQSSITEDG